MDSTQTRACLLSRSLWPAEHTSQPNARASWCACLQIVAVSKYVVYLKMHKQVERIFKRWDMGTHEGGFDRAELLKHIADKEARRPV